MFVCLKRDAPAKENLLKDRTVNGTSASFFGVLRLTSELLRPPEGWSNAVGLLLADAKLAKVPLTVLVLIPCFLPLGYFYKTECFVV